MSIKFKDAPDVMYIRNEGWFSQWCCTCGNRHIWNFTIHRGKKEEEDFVEIRGFQDDMGTKLRKHYNLTTKPKIK